MGVRSLPRKAMDVNVWEAALERTRYTYETFDKTIVFFSGGKDSTVVLEAAIEVARQIGKLPVPAYLWDDEVLDPDTVAFLERTRARPEVDFHWLCMPTTYRNACSFDSPFWHPWDPDCPELWTREKPEWAITELPGFVRQRPGNAHATLFPRDGSTVGCLMGVRADESMIRLRSVSHRHADNYIIPTHDAPWVALVKSIYDWNDVDVWSAPRQFGWDHNYAYDMMAMAGVSMNNQRVAPPYGEQPMQRLWTWQVCWPEVWDKMINRVPGAATAARYGRTELYGAFDLPRPAPGQSWQEAVVAALERHPPKGRAYVATAISGYLRMHRKQCGEDVPMTEMEADPGCGVSWSYILQAAIRGDYLRRSDPKQKVKAIPWAQVQADRKAQTARVAKARTRTSGRRRLARASR